MVPPVVLIAHVSGWSIIPVKPDKKALVKWKEFQTTRAPLEQLEEWARDLRPAAWAVVTGMISRIVVLDFDGEDGARTLARLGYQPNVRTPSGGFHVYVEYPGWPVKSTNRKSDPTLGKMYPGLDVRGDGGYAIFFGTVNGGTYERLS